jgi:hypothetical protein
LNIFNGIFKKDIFNNLLISQRFFKFPHRLFLVEDLCCRFGYNLGTYFALRKGKPPEKAGRKATGLNPGGGKGSRAAGREQHVS